MPLLIALFIVVPIVELWAIIQVGGLVIGDGIGGPSGGGEPRVDQRGVAAGPRHHRIEAAEPFRPRHRPPAVFHAQHRGCVDGLAGEEGLVEHAGLA